MRFSSREKIVKIDGPMAAKVIVLWWLLSLIVVRAILPFAGPLLDSVWQAVPAVQQYGLASGYNKEVAGFYCFFLVTSPFVAVYYYRFTTVTQDFSFGLKLVLWFVILVCPFGMIVGFDFGPEATGAHSRMFRMVLTSSWLGSSFLFGLFYHVFISSIVCLAKDAAIRLAPAQ